MSWRQSPSPWSRECLCNGSRPRPGNQMTEDGCLRSRFCCTAGSRGVTVTHQRTWRPSLRFEQKTAVAGPSSPLFLVRHVRVDTFLLSIFRKINFLN